MNGQKKKSSQFYDSPPENQRFSLTNVSSSGLLDARKDTIEKKVSIYFLVCEGLSIDDVGVSRDTVFQEIRPAISLKKSWGGYRSKTQKWYDTSIILSTRGLHLVPEPISGKIKSATS